MSTHTTAQSTGASFSKNQTIDLILRLLVVALLLYLFLVGVKVLGTSFKLMGGGLVMWYVNPTMREIPLKLCEGLANLTQKNRGYGIAYIVCVFFALPFLLTIVL